jgi:hypothetical protein
MFQSVVHNNSVILSTTQTTGSGLIVQDVGVEYLYGSRFLVPADDGLSPILPLARLKQIILLLE